MFDNTAYCSLPKLEITLCTYSSSYICVGVNHLSDSRRVGNIIMISVTKLYFVIYSLTLLQLSFGCCPVADPSMSNHIAIHKYIEKFPQSFLRSFHSPLKVS